MNTTGQGRIVLVSGADHNPMIRANLLVQADKMTPVMCQHYAAHSVGNRKNVRIIPPTVPGFLNR